MKTMYSPSECLSAYLIGIATGLLIVHALGRPRSSLRKPPATPIPPRSEATPGGHPGGSEGLSDQGSYPDKLPHVHEWFGEMDEGGLYCRCGAWKHRG